MSRSTVAPHLVEILTDADYAGNRDDRKSATSFQIYIDGGLSESRVRTQKSKALSSGESAVVAGCSDGMLMKRLLNKMTGGSCAVKVRTDSSAARSMVQRQGIGRVHLDASLLWVQQKESERAFSVAAIPSELNCADIAKNLTRKRLLGLLYMIKMIDVIGDRVGYEEYKDLDLEYQYQIKRGAKKMMNSEDLRIGLLLLMASVSSVAGSSTEEVEKGSTDFGWMMLVACAVIGALSTLRWLRIFLLWLDWKSGQV